jgi:glucosamine-6-phosphate deaminase
MLQEFKADQLNVRIYENRREMGAAAAKAAAIAIRKLLNEKQEVNIIFAAAPSQNEFLEVLQKEKEIAWEQINAFHMDEYIALAADAPQGFGNFLKDRIFGLFPFKTVNYLNGNAPDLAAECERYTLLLKNFPPDVVCMGIGENGHLAFNDPPVADFNDKHLVKIVELDEACILQQVNDGCFSAQNEVPKQALTLTIPAMLQAKLIFCMVPGPTKKQAVYHTLNEQVAEKFPSTILRTHHNATLFLDGQSSSLLTTATNQ